LVTELFECA